MSAKRILKIKKIKTGWQIKYQTFEGKDRIPVTHFYPSDPEDFVGGEPTNKFLNALDPFVSYAINWACLSDEWEDFGNVIGISFKYEEGGVGATITVSGRPDDESPTVNVTTPYINPKRFDYAQKNFKTLFEQIEKYREGERKVEQLKLAVV